MAGDRELGFMSAGALLDAYRRKALSPVEATKAALARIERLEPKLNAFVLVDAEGALAAARQSEARWARGAPQGLVDGVPTTIKDLLLTKGWPTLRGSRLTRRDQDWSEESPAVARQPAEEDALGIGATSPSAMTGPKLTGGSHRWTGYAAALLWSQVAPRGWGARSLSCSPAKARMWRLSTSTSRRPERWRTRSGG